MLCTNSGDEITRISATADFSVVIMAYNLNVNNLEAPDVGLPHLLKYVMFHLSDMFCPQAPHMPTPSSACTVENRTGNFCQRIILCCVMENDGNFTP